MKKKLLLLVLVLLLALHVPVIYGLYRSYQVKRYVASLEVEAEASLFQDVRGVFHVHSARGGHSLGTYPEIVEAALSVGCRFVFLTEHPGGSKGPFEPREGNVLLIHGTEQEESGLRVLADEDGVFRVGSEVQIGVRLTGLQGLEIFNLHESARAADSWYLRVLAFYHQLFLNPYFAFHLWEMNEGRLALWEQVLADRPLTGVGGADAHQNVGLQIQTSAGQQMVRLQLDPYADSFRFITTHVVLEPHVPVTAESIIAALRGGAAYLAFETIKASDGFSFHALEGGQALRMGSTVTRRAVLIVQSPLPAHIRLLHNGSLEREVEGRKFEFKDLKSGHYRVEVYPLDAPPLLASKPWILSNPIYVRDAEPRTQNLFQIPIQPVKEEALPQHPVLGRQDPVAFFREIDKATRNPL